MRNLLIVLLLLAACSKPAPITDPEQYLHKDYLPEMPAGAKGGVPGKPKPTKPPVVIPPAPVSATSMALITFAPHYEANPGWRGEPFYSNGSDIPNQAEIIAQAAKFYEKYNIEFTTDEYKYQQFTGKKIMVQVTDDVWNPEYPSSGLAFHGSMQIGGNTCYIFAKVLQYNPDWVAKLIAHEVGHTCGLYHQEEYEDNCNHINNYRYGAVMGQCFYDPECLWVFGQTWSCETWEDDDRKLTNYLGLR